MRYEDAYAGRPSVCRQCGALVGAGESHCAVCGAPAARPGAAPDGRRPVAQPPPDPETMRFVRAIVSRPATFTFVFLAANVLLFLLVTLSGGSQDSGVLVAYGAKVNRLIDAGEWWRLVTPIFLHGSALHLLVNMYGLFVLGPYVEKLYGSAKFVVFWVLTGVCGVAASYLALQPQLTGTVWGRFLFEDVDVASVGASGSLFGLIGVLFVFGLKFRHELPEGFKRAFGTGMLPTIVINLFIGFTIPFIDNAAHLGGLVSGALLALFVGYKRPGARARVAYAWHLLQACALALVLAGFGMVALHFRGPAPGLGKLRVSPLPDPSGLKSYIEAVNRSGEAFERALEGEPGEAEAVARALDEAPYFDEEEARLRDELRQLLQSAREFGAAGAEERRLPAARRRREELEKRFAGWAERLDAWVAASGEAHGVGRRDPAGGGANEGKEGKK